MGKVNIDVDIDYRAIEYEEEMPVVLNSADLIVSGVQLPLKLIC